MTNAATPMPAASPVLERVRHAILDGLWVPGDRLPPGALAELYESSTTVVREALTRLVGESLVEARTNRGFFVPELRLQEFVDLTDLRCATESLALKLSLERGDLKWETELIAVHHRMTRTPRRQLGGRHVNEGWRIAHWGFHNALLSACGCEPMLKIASSLMQSTDLYRIWAAPAPAASVRDVEAEHQQLLDAALARDTERAIGLLTHHYRETARIVAEAGLRLGPDSSTK